MFFTFLKAACLMMIVICLMQPVQAELMQLGPYCCDVQTTVGTHCYTSDMPFVVDVASFSGIYQLVSYVQDMWFDDPYRDAIYICSPGDAGSNDSCDNCVGSVSITDETEVFKCRGDYQYEKAYGGSKTNTLCYCNTVRGYFANYAISPFADGFAKIESAKCGLSEIESFPVEAKYIVNLFISNDSSRYDSENMTNPWLPMNITSDFMNETSDDPEKLSNDTVLVPVQDEDVVSTRQIINDDLMNQVEAVKLMQNVLDRVSSAAFIDLPMTIVNHDMLATPLGLFALSSLSYKLLSLEQVRIDQIEGNSSKLNDFYISIDSNFITMMYPTDNQKIISYSCQGNQQNSVCENKTCSYDTAAICFSMSELYVRSYLGDSVKTATLRCPEISFKQCASYTASQFFSTPWACRSWYTVIGISLSIIFILIFCVFGFCKFWAMCSQAQKSPMGDLEAADISAGMSWTSCFWRTRARRQEVAAMPMMPLQNNQERPSSINIVNNIPNSNTNSDQTKPLGRQVFVIESDGLTNSSAYDDDVLYTVQKAPALRREFMPSQTLTEEEQLDADISTDEDIRGELRSLVNMDPRSKVIWESAIQKKSLDKKRRKKEEREARRRDNISKRTSRVFKESMSVLTILKICVFFITLLSGMPVGLAATYQPYSTFCSQSSTITGIPTQECLVGPVTRNCTFGVTLQNTLLNPGAVTCFDLVYNGTLFSKVYVEYVRHSQEITLQDAYWTSGWTGLAHSNRRCGQSSPCKGSKCGRIFANDTNALGVLKDHPVTKYPGSTSCSQTCGCAGCKCPLCEAACLYSRGAFMPVAPFYLTKNLMTIINKPIVQMTFVRNKTVFDQVTFSTSGSSAVAGITASISGNFQSTVSQIFGSSSVILNPTTNTAYYGSISSMASPVAQKIGDIQGSTLSSLQNPTPTSFNWAKSMMSFTVSTSSTIYTFAQPGIAELFNPSAYKKFPTVLGGQTWIYNSGLLKSNNSNPGALQYNMRMSKTFEITQEISQVCPKIISIDSTGGCYNCLSYAFVSFKAQSTCASGSVELNITRVDSQTNDEIIKTIILNTGVTGYNVTFNSPSASYSGKICLRFMSSVNCMPFTAVLSSDINTGSNNETNADNDGTTDGGISLSGFDKFKNWMKNYYGVIIFVIIGIAAVILVVVGFILFKRVQFFNDLGHSAFDKIVPERAKRLLRRRDSVRNEHVPLKQDDSSELLTDTNVSEMSR